MGRTTENNDQGEKIWVSSAGGHASKLAAIQYHSQLLLIPPPHFDTMVMCDNMMFI
jgi:hypothetical protein